MHRALKNQATSGLKNTQKWKLEYRVCSGIKNWFQTGILWAQACSGATLQIITLKFDPWYFEQSAVSNPENQRKTDSPMKLNVVADFLQRDESRWLYVCRSLSQNQQQLHAIKIWHIFCPNSKKLYLPYFCQLYDLINGFGIHNLTEESGFDLPKCQFGLVFWDLQTRSNCSTLTRLLWITFKGFVLLFCSDWSNNVWRLMFDRS